MLLYISVHVCEPRSVTVCQSAHVHPLVDVLPVCVLPCVSMHKSVYCTVSGCFCVFACMWLLLSFSVYLCVTVHLCKCLWATVNLSVSFSPCLSWVAFYVSIWVSGRLYVCFSYLGCMWLLLSFSVFFVLLHISVRVCEPLSISACHSAPVYLEWLCKSLYVGLGVCVYVAAI